MQLGRIGTGAQINVLTDVVYNYSEVTSVRICAAGALRQMGETSTALGIYELWARDTDPDLRRAAILGFGEIGPEATATALPYLERAFGSEFMDVRYLVVESLGKLGPEADALLMEATKDQESLVSTRANALLKARGR
jgi:HEAT repeat protein